MILSTACRKDRNSIDISSLKAKDYATLSAVDKKQFETKMITALRQDPEYFELNKNFQKIITYHLNLPHQKFAKTKLPRKGSELIEHYRKLGISNPEDYFKTKIFTLRGIALLKKNYPELFKLETSVKHHIMVDAAKPIKVVTALKLKKQASKF